jgi:hypothetical protein
MTNKQKIVLQRKPLTEVDFARLLPSEISKLNLTDEETGRLRAFNNARAIARAESSIRMRSEEEPLLADLRAIGWRVESVWDLVNTRTQYPEALTTLLNHLQRPYSDRIKEGIARALAVPEARDAWSTLVAEYKKAPIGKGIKVFGDKEEFRLGFKNGLACALSATVTDVTVAELIELAKNQDHGESRLLLLAGLRKSKGNAVKQALHELAQDSELEKEIASWGKSQQKFSD